MITCYLRYVIDPDKLDEFETYAKAWIPLVNKFGGIHHGAGKSNTTPFLSQSVAGAARNINSLPDLL